mmetsp:Transcript_7464/g.18303  ORF Transcript_7464/g.18303 Transcript_7464/m.18303 type:complete len:94 (+) Transcript_7464:2826-3107(+)
MENSQIYHGENSFSPQIESEPSVQFMKRSKIDTALWKNNGRHRTVMLFRRELHLDLDIVRGGADDGSSKSGDDPSDERVVHSCLHGIEDRKHD